MEPPTVVIDNGTGYTKMGYSGNMDPSYIIPSTIATSLNKVSHHSLLTPAEKHEVRLSGDGLLYRRRGHGTLKDTLNQLPAPRRPDRRLGGH